MLFSLSGSAQRETIDLAGAWNFKLDPEDVGEKEAWFSENLPEIVELPGSLKTNDKGNPVRLDTEWTGSIYDSSFYYNPRYKKYRQAEDIKFPFWLTPNKHYVGAAWYQKEVAIPESWGRKRILLKLERAHTETTIWVNNDKIGMQNSMVAPHVYDLTDYLSKGNHLISIRVDNRIKDINVGPDSHSLTDHTQGNWNGLIGELSLEAINEVYIDNVKVYPDVQNAKAKLKIYLGSVHEKSVSGTLHISAKSFNTKKEHHSESLKIPYKISKRKDSLEVVLEMGENFQTWDEFNPALYKLSVELNSENSGNDKISTQFGMRKFDTEGKNFTLNGRPIFLRGTLENAVFPLKGYPAMEVDWWKEIFERTKEYGFNHVRFHSWCPPEAAFKAADLVGIYLQPEGPSWANHGTSLGVGDPIDEYIYKETGLMSKYYGNYASFGFMAYGNEPSGKQVEYLTAFNEYWKKKDPRRLYTGASVGGSWPVIENNQFMVRGGARGLKWTNNPPQSTDDFSKEISKFNVPFVSHETGQYCVFPNFNEIDKYTGVYKAKNFELFQEDLADHHMAHKAQDFFMASGKLQALVYKYDMEKALRTPGYSGYQILSLSDYPGQGTALVGVLDAFWDPKPYTNAAYFRQFTNSTVLLAEIPKFVYKNSEAFKTEILVANYGKEKLTNSVEWQLKQENGKIIKSGKFEAKELPIGGTFKVGDIYIELSEIESSQKLTLTTSIKDLNTKNEWNIWVYPKSLPVVDSQIHTTDTLDYKAKNILASGGKVFLNAAGKVIKGKEVAQTFLPVFWNTSWFQMRPPHTLGILVDPDHKVFENFTTDYHSDLQWWSIVNKIQVMHTEDFSPDFEPLIQPIDTWFMNRRLALLFETKIGKGKLMVSSIDFERPESDAASDQLLFSIKKYMTSDDFEPENEIPLEKIEDIFISESIQQYDKYTKDSPADLIPD